MVRDTPLYDLIHGWHNIYRGAIESSDHIAAGLDRWLITLLLEHGEKRVYIPSNILLNPFDPRIGVKLGEEDLDKLRLKASEIAGELNKLLSSLNKLGDSVGGYSTKLLAYTLLYTLLEILHYIKGLPPSLADTRVPTHNIYDHLYATTSMTNLVIPEEKLWIPRGFIAVFDIPGIQDFIMASRKAGDYWAASWLLSMVSWGVAEEIMKRLGPDVVLSPTPRFNISFYSYVVRLLREIEDKLHSDGQEEKAKIVGEIRGRVEKYVNEFLKSIAKERIEGDRDLTLDSVGGYALTPATIIFVLPRIRVGELDFEGVENVVNTLKRLGEEVWRRVIEKLDKYFDYLCTKDKRYCIANTLLKAIRDIVSKPFTGFRIAVINIEDIYKALSECIKGYEDKCEYLGKKVDRDALDKLLREISEKSGRSTDEIVDVITRSLILHEALIQLFREEPKYSKYRTIPMPRPFWRLTTSGDRLEPISQILIDKHGEPGSWIPCSLCGFEPAVIRLGKTIRREVIGGRERTYESFEYEDIKKLIDMLKNYTGVDICEGVPENKCIGDVGNMLMELGIKPGETLGPYCLLKRLIYIATIPSGAEAEKLRVELGLPQRVIPSTDDIALKSYEESLIVLTPLHSCGDLVRSICSELVPILEKQDIKDIDYYDCYNALQSVFCEYMPKDLDITAYTLRISYELLIKKLSETVKRFIEARMDIHLFEKFIEARYGVRSVPEWLKNLIVKSYRSRASHINTELAELYDGYLIVKGDADNAGLIARGHLDQIAKELSCEEYSRYVLSALESQKYPGYSVEALERLRNVFTWICRIAEILYGDKACGHGKSKPIVVSPSYYQAFSSALTITAIKDFASIRRAEGLLVFSGGDDVLAVLPPQRLWTVFELRFNYAGSRVRPGFHCFNGTPVIPAIPFGRSFSARFAKIKDLMNEEIRETVELLENRAKEAVWRLPGDELRKDTIVISRSRSEALAMFPLSKYTSQGFKCLAEELGSYILSLHLMLISDIVSANIPEDLDKFVLEALDVLSYRPSDMHKLFMYIVSRNIRIREDAPDILESVLGRHPEVRDLLINTQLVLDSKTSPLLIELSKLIKVLRVIS